MLLKNLLKDSFKKSLVLMMTHEWIFKQTYYSETSLLRTRLFLFHYRAHLTMSDGLFSIYE